MTYRTRRQGDTFTRQLYLESEGKPLLVAPDGVTPRVNKIELRLFKGSVPIMDSTFNYPYTPGEGLELKLVADIPHAVELDVTRSLSKTLPVGSIEAHIRVELATLPPESVELVRPVAWMIPGLLNAD